MQEFVAPLQAGQVDELQHQVRTLEDRVARAEVTARSLDSQLSAAGTALQEARHDAIGLRAANQRLTAEMQRLAALSQERDRLSADTASPGECPFRLPIQISTFLLMRASETCILPCLSGLSAHADVACSSQWRLRCSLGG